MRVFDLAYRFDFDDDFSVDDQIDAVAIDSEAGTRGKTHEPVVLAYEGSTGYNEAMPPADRIFCVERETSMECVAAELARLVKREDNTSEKLKVICYEGCDKGAIAEA